MSSTARKLQYTPAEYLAYEAEAEFKHELVNGEIVAMSGGTPAHSLISIEMIIVLRGLLAGRPCTIFNTDLRVCVDETGLYTYPDLAVTCEPPAFHPDDPNSLVNPVLIVEVLSPSTEAYDRGAKFAHYRQLPSLQAYLLVNQDTHRLECFQRAPNGVWLYTVAETGCLKVLDVCIPVAEVYATADQLSQA